MLNKEIIPSETKLIYIMGRGHSGSTVLDALLGNADSIESVGELVSGLCREGEVCSCVAPFNKCEFWSQVRTEFEMRANMSLEEAADLLKFQAHVARFLKTFFARSNSSSIKKLTLVNQSIVEAVLKVSEKKCMVDSTKEHTRALFIIRFSSNAKIIHLVRDPEGILASNFFRIKKGSGFKFLRRKFSGKRMIPFFMILNCINWIIGNIMAETIRLFAPDRVFRLRYEDLCKNPTEALKRLQLFMEYDLSSVIKSVESGKSMSIGHNIGGNMMRNKSYFIFDPKAGKRRPLPWVYKFIARLICWPFLLMYGYKLIGNR